MKRPFSDDARAPPRKVPRLNAPPVLADMGTRLLQPPTPPTPLIVARDARIRFVDKDAQTGEDLHQYWIDGQLVPPGLSASKYHEFFSPHFISDRAAQRSADRVNREESIRLKRPVDDATVESMQAEWNKERDWGKYMHTLYEKICGAIPLSQEEHDDVPPGFFQMLLDHPMWKIYRTEWVIFYDEDNGFRIPGSIDIVFEDTAYPEGHPRRFILGDWKNIRDGTMTKEWPYRHGPRAKRREVECFWHPMFLDWPNMKLRHYYLQLNMYRYMLVQRYGMHIERIVLFNFPPQTPLVYHAYDIPVVDMQPSLDLVKDGWKDDDMRHLTEGDPAKEFACERITARDKRGRGLTTVAAYNTKQGMPPGAVWVGKEWKKGGLPDSVWQCIYYPDVEFTKGEVATAYELKCAGLQYERDLLRWPAVALHRWQELDGATLVTWDRETEHAYILARYVNALSTGKITLRPMPTVPLEPLKRYFPSPAALMTCAQCYTEANDHSSVVYIKATNELEWPCIGCDMRMTRRRILELV